MARLGLDPRVAATLWPLPTPPTAADVQEGLRRHVSDWARVGFGLWLLRDRVTGELVGRGGLEETTAPGEPAVEAAWTIVPERWGQGLATELARAAIRTGFETLELPELIALTLPHNPASRRVMEKTGFVFDRDITWVGLPHVLYRLARPPERGRSPPMSSTLRHFGQRSRPAGPEPAAPVAMLRTS